MCCALGSLAKRTITSDRRAFPKWRKAFFIAGALPRRAARVRSAGVLCGSTLWKYIAEANRRHDESEVAVAPPVAFEERSARRRSASDASDASEAAGFRGSPPEAASEIGRAVTWMHLTRR